MLYFESILCSIIYTQIARVAELVDARDLKSLALRGVPVRFWLRAPSFFVTLRCLRSLCCSCTSVHSAARSLVASIYEKIWRPELLCRILSVRVFRSFASSLPALAVLLMHKCALRCSLACRLGLRKNMAPGASWRGFFWGFSKLRFSSLFGLFV